MRSISATDRKIAESTAVYTTMRFDGMVENGAISKPDSEGRLMPQMSSSTNNNMRCFIVSALLLFVSILFKSFDFRSLFGVAISHASTAADPCNVLNT